MEVASIQAAGYVLHELLGEGRFSQVVRTVHTTTGSEYAVKIVERASIADDAGAFEALQVELKVLQAAQHPHIVALHEVVETPSTTYVVMELVAGGELFDEIVSRGSLPEQEVIALGAQLFEAIAFCHGLGVAHRDLKPENILLDRSGAQPRLKVIDFGYAALLTDGEPLVGLAGTPDYVAPEVLSWYDGEAQVTGPWTWTTPWHRQAGQTRYELCARTRGGRRASYMSIRSTTRRVTSGVLASSCTYCSVASRHFTPTPKRSSSAWCAAAAPPYPPLPPLTPHARCSLEFSHENSRLKLSASCIVERLADGHRYARCSTSSPRHTGTQSQLRRRR
jgi:serine/threonine protein kinase